MKYKYDVFVSHSSEDSAVVLQLEKAFGQLGIRCWIAPNDISPGDDWNASIVEGISRSRMMVLIYSSRSNQSEHVKNELVLAVDRQMPIIPFKIEDAPLSDFMKLNLSRRQWQIAFEGPMDRHI